MNSNKTITVYQDNDRYDDDRYCLVFENEFADFLRGKYSSKN